MPSHSSHHRAETTKRTTRRFGKDELNLADWRISVSQFQQPRTKDGGTIDYVEYVLDRPKAPQQKVTVQAPSRLGLPTPVEEDVLIALLFLAKQQNFDHERLHFVPAEVLHVLRWTDGRRNYDRLQTALHRLQAVSICYELTWYNKQKAEVEPILMTGILAEAKLVRRQGRRATDALPDSYVQWTPHFFGSLQDGNLTDLDLDLYFQLSKPGAKQLLRHLNKVWHAGKRPRHYERDLRQLACGHLGMKDSKDLKRNFDAIVRELEDIGYLAPIEQRYQKIGKGIWRASFDLADLFQRTPGQARRGDVATTKTSAADELVQRYLQLRFGTPRAAKRHELQHAQRLLAQHDHELLLRLLPKAAKETEASFNSKDKVFGAAVETLESLIAEHHAKDESRRQAQAEQAQAIVEETAVRLAKQARRERLEQARQAFLRLSETDRAAIYEAAIAAMPVGYDRTRLIRNRSLIDPPRAVLDYFTDHHVSI